MTRLLQIIAPFAVVFLIAVILAITKKKTRLVLCTVAVGILPVAVLTCLFANRLFDRIPEELTEQAVTVSGSTNASGCIDLANLLMTKGLTRTAEDTLDEFAERYPMSKEYLRSRAHLAALRGNYSEAQGILRSLIASGELSEDAVRTELDALESAAKGSLTHADLVDTVVGIIKERDVVQYLSKLVSLYAQLDRVDMSDLTENNIPEELFEAAGEYAKIVEKHPNTVFPSPFRVAYLKSLILADDYPEILRQSADCKSADEFLILGTLCTNNKFTKDHLKKANAVTSDREEKQKIADWMRKEVKRYDFGDDTERIKRAIEELSETHTDSLDAFRAWVNERILVLAKTPGEREASKLYLELAYIAYLDGDTDGASANIRLALTTGADSRDISYTTPVKQLNEILENKDNTEELKNIDSCVKQMVGNMQAEGMKSDSGVDVNINLSDFEEAVRDRLFYGDEYNVPSEFNEFVGAQVNQITASINIASVDASKFDEVSAIVSIDERIAADAEQFRQNIDVLDCGITIPDYKVEKLENTGMNIILVCDNSGSMSGTKIENLKKAVETFVNGKASEVSIGIVSFSDNVLSKASAKLGSTASLKEAISNMGAYNGTSIYSGVSEALSQMKASDSINVIILMSDGQDSSLSDAQAAELSQDCLERGVVIYAMGLGNDVDSDVLSQYSSAGGGSYTFVSDSGTLLSFYNYLYNISRNRFRITYTAQDTLLSNRALWIGYHSDAKVFDTRSYSLRESGGLDSDSLGEDYSLTLEEITLGGLDTRLLYKSTVDQVVHLRGTNLTKEKQIRVSIRSGANYDLTAEYVSDDDWKITVPASVPCGEYDVAVTVNGKRGVFESGLVISDTRLNTVRFGPYIFEASSVGRTDNQIVLSGYVRMNDWLGFTGNVTVTGDLASGSSVMLDAPMSYVRYRSGDTELNALASYMSKHGSVINLFRIQRHTLFRNEAIPFDSDDFRADPVAIPVLTIQNLFELNSPGLSIYPDRMELTFDEFTTKFPLQDTLLKESGLDKIFKFEMEHEEALIISQKAVDCKLEIKVSSTDDDVYDEVPISRSKKINALFGNMRLLVNLDEFNLKIDTSEDEYSFKITTNLGMLIDGVGFELKWADGKLDAVHLFADKDIETNIGGIPATFSDFDVGVDGLSEAGKKGIDISGECKISFVKVSSYYKGLEKYLGDVSLFALDDVKINFHFGDFRMKLSAKATLLEKVEIGHAAVEIGIGIPYSNVLLGYSKEPVNGIVGSVGAGIKVDWSNLKLDVGVEAELALTNNVCGFTATGKCKYDVHWWIIGKHDEFTGSVFLGFYRKHNQKEAFVLAFQQDGKEVQRFEWETGKVIA